MKIKIKESELKDIIKECLTEQSRSWFDYMRSEHPEERIGDDKYANVLDKMDARHRSHYDDGKNEYIPVNKDNEYARNIFKYSSPETVNDVVKNSKKEKSLQDLHRFDGTYKEGEDPEFLGWETFSPDFATGINGINASKMRKAKMFYDTKNMTPDERAEYIKKNFPGRYSTKNGLAK